MAKRTNGLVGDEAVSKKLSIKEVAHQLEAQKISPDTLDKETKMKCVLFFVTRGYSNDEIAEILGVSIRTVQRYQEEIHTENVLVLDDQFQRRIAADFYSNWKSNRQRLLRISYSGTLSDMETARVIYMLHQLDVSNIAVLERLGYLSYDHGISEHNGVKAESRVSYAMTNILETKESLHKNAKSMEGFTGSKEEHKKAYHEMCQEEVRLIERQISNAKIVIEIEEKKMRNN